MTAKRRSPKRGLQLRLFIAGGAPNSVQAVANIRAICEQHFAGAFALEIVDILATPERALAEGIIVSPTLLKVAPLPTRCIVGTLADASQVLLSLGAL